jgi:anti-sigma factor ChrR (cupin superfamily)
MTTTDREDTGDLANPPELRSTYVDPAGMAWQPTPFDGVEMKLLYADAEQGRSTMLFKLAPGAAIPPHTHLDVEQTYVLSGVFEDAEGRAEAGQFVWRPAGNRHVAGSPDGAVILSVFLQPNRFDAGTPFFTSASAADPPVSPRSGPPGP